MGVAVGNRSCRAETILSYQGETETKLAEALRQGVDAPESVVSGTTHVTSAPPEPAAIQGPVFTVKLDTSAPESSGAYQTIRQIIRQSGKVRIVLPGETVGLDGLATNDRLSLIQDRWVVPLTPISRRSLGRIAGLTAKNTLIVATTRRGNKTSRDLSFVVDTMSPVLTGHLANDDGEQFGRIYARSEPSASYGYQRHRKP